MICEACHGERMTLIAGMVIPCQECHGIGIVHCCEGERPDICAGVPPQLSAQRERSRRLAAPTVTPGEGQEPQHPYVPE
jgi:hypothetical protein